MLLSTCNLPVMVPEMTVPFFSSIWTTSFDNFIRNLHQRLLYEQCVRKMELARCWMLPRT